MSATTVAAMATRGLSVSDEIRAARAARDAGMARSLEGEHKALNVALVDTAIAAFARRGLPFSANDVRPHLPEECAPLMGACFGRASAQELIRQVGGDTSSKRTTHSKGIALWIGTSTQETP